MIVEGPFSQSWLEKKKQPWHFYSSGSTQSVSVIQNNDFLNLSGSSPLMLISIFELSLFNKLVIKEIKSGIIMEQIQNQQLIYRLIDEYFDKFQKNQLDQNFNKKDTDMTITNENIESNCKQQDALFLKIRFAFALMFCAFEIKNDMNHSVILYQKLQNLIFAYKQMNIDNQKRQSQDQLSQPNSSISIHLPHIDSQFYLDNQRMAEFGDLKIKQARTFKDFDQGLMKLKQREHRLQQLSLIDNNQQNPVQNSKSAKNENLQKQKNELAQQAQAAQMKLDKLEIEDIEQKIDEKEFDKYASFYLDQFFTYLNASVQVQVNSQEQWAQSVLLVKNQDNLNKSQLEDKINPQNGSAGTSNGSSQIQNEEKVKEMWQQLVYSLCRASTPLLLKAVQNIFCVFTAITYLNKGFYEQFILKKLDFQKIIYSINQRLTEIYHSIEKDLKYKEDFDDLNAEDILSISQIKHRVALKVGKMLGINNFGDIDDALNMNDFLIKIEAQLVKLQLSFLRQFTPEFFHYNIFLTHSSNTAFLNMISNSGIQNSLINNLYMDQKQTINSQNQNNLQIIQNMAINSRTQQKQNLQQCNIYPTMLVDLFPQILYHLEFFKCIINADSQKDNSQNLKSILRLFIHFDKLTTQNDEKKEMFCKSYTQLIVHSFPVLVNCLQIDIERFKVTNQFNSLILTNQNLLQDLILQNPIKIFKKLDQKIQLVFNILAHQQIKQNQQLSPQNSALQNFQLAQIQIQSQSGLVQFITQALKFFFEIKFDLKSLDESQKNKSFDFQNEDETLEKDLGGELVIREDYGKNKGKEDQEMEDDQENKNDQSYDDDNNEDFYYSKWTHLTCIFSQLKREKQSKSWKDFSQSGVLQNKSPMLQYFLSSCPLDFSILSDLIQIISFLNQNRLFKQGEINYKDIKIFQAFNEILIDFLSSQLGKINDQVHNSDLGKILTQKLKDNKINNQFNSQQFDQDCQLIIDQHFPKLEDNQIQRKKFKESKNLKIVLDYLVNFCQTILLQWSQFQNPRFDITFKIGNHSNQQYLQNQQNQNQPGQNSLQSTNSGLSQQNQSSLQNQLNNFYFAYNKKGSALGNISVQIAKIHENLLNLMQNQNGLQFESDDILSQDQNQSQGGSQINQFKNPFLFFKYIINQTLRFFNCLVKLDMQMLGEFYFQQTKIQITNEQDQVENEQLKQIQQQLNQICSYEVLFNQSLMQSLIHFQQYTINSNENLFIQKQKESENIKKQSFFKQSNIQPAKSQILQAIDEAVAQQKDIQDINKLNKTQYQQDKIIQQRYFQSSIQNSFLALRFLIQRQSVFQYLNDQSNKEILKAFDNHGKNIKKIQEIFLQNFEIVQKNMNQWSNENNFLQFIKMVIEHLISILIFRIEFIKSKNCIQESINNDKQNQIYEKILGIKQSCKLLANIGDFIDVFSTPSRDPRINNKLKKNIIQNHIIELIKLFLDQVDIQSDNISQLLQKKNFLNKEKIEIINQRLQEIGHQCNFESRKNEQRLNLNFIYSYVQAKCETNDEQGQSLDKLKIKKILTYKRCLEISLSNRSINGVLESLLKLIKYSLDIGLILKYKKQNIKNQNDIQEFQHVIQNIIKPVIQDQELKRFLLKALIQNQSGRDLDLDFQDDQNEGFKQQLSDEKINKDINMEEKNLSFQEVDDTIIQNDTNAYNVRSKLIKKVNKSSQEDLFISIDNQGSLREENDLIQIYKFSDFICNNLNNPNKQILKIDFVLMNAQYLFKELKEIECEQIQKSKANNDENNISTDKLKYLIDMLKPSLFQLCLNYDENWNGLIYDEQDKKNIITSLRNQELTGITNKRLKFIIFFIDLCRQAFDYEPIKEVYKKQLQIFKLQDQLFPVSAQLQPGSSQFYINQSSNITLISHKILFDLSLKQFIQVLCSFINDQLSKYMQVRKTVTQQLVKQNKQSEPENKWKAQSGKSALDAYLNMRLQYQVSKDQTPAILKEIFDLFIDSYSKKGYLSSRKLLNDLQKSQIIQTLLNCCAMCGPDNIQPQNIVENQGQAEDGQIAKQIAKIQISKFLDFAKISTVEYQIEGLKICVQWYSDVLEKQQPKIKNQELIKKLKTTFEEFLQSIKK